jgi:hypothetical protein
VGFIENNHEENNIGVWNSSGSDKNGSFGERVSKTYPRV